MAAPKETIWGDIVNNKGRIGIYKKLSTTETTSTLTVQIWFWSVYSCTDSNHSLYFNDRSTTGSATTKVTAPNISTTSGASWSESNQQKLYTYTETYDRGTDVQKRYIYAKLSSVDYVGDTMYVSTTASIPALDRIPGLIYIDDGEEFVGYQFYIDNGENWELYVPYVDDGTAWVLCD